MSDLSVIVTGVIVGSASGIAGTILGGWMTGRQQMTGLRFSLGAENERAMRADKRQLYAQAIAALSSLHLSTLDVRNADHRTDRKAAWARHVQVLEQSTATMFELDLVAPPPIGKLAEIALKAAISAEDAQDQQLGPALQNLVTALRADLRASV